jgi:hypothetical protein
MRACIHTHMHTNVHAIDDTMWNSRHHGRKTKTEQAHQECSQDEFPSEELQPVHARWVEAPWNRSAASEQLRWYACLVFSTSKLTELSHMGGHQSPMIAALVNKCDRRHHSLGPLILVLFGPKSHSRSTQSDFFCFVPIVIRLLFLMLS